jgi:GNAT superfamily N-acetyltransferase
VTSFYRDCIGLPEVGRFADHDGYDGVFLDVPGTRAHLELTGGGNRAAPQPHAESLIVLYLETQAQIDVIAARVAQPPVVPANPYWRSHAVAYEDPDGFQVLLTLEDPVAEPAVIHVSHHSGPRTELRSLFELAEDSAAELDSYIHRGRVLVALEDDVVIGHLQLTETDAGEAEIKNMAVRDTHRRRGTGRKLIRAAIELAATERRRALLVATAAADVDNLRFYQRAGFRMRAIERDAFTVENGYGPAMLIDGIELRDRVRLELCLGRRP